MKRSRWIGFARAAILVFMVILFANCLTLFLEIKRDVSYGSRSTGLAALNEYFDNGKYEKIYTSTVVNKYADDELSVDASQYEAFGRYYHAYTMARTHEDNSKYIEQMKAEKASISWKKILEVIDMLEAQM